MEFNLRNSKMLINCSYNTHKAEIKKHLTALGNSLDFSGVTERVHQMRYQRTPEKACPF